jgi:polyisoprenoid-binding protein YceI
MATTWKIDQSHSELSFKVKHLMITTVTGKFKEFEGQVVTAGADFTAPSSISFSAEIASIDTNSEQRDTHLKSEEFFDAAKFAKLTFTGTKFDDLTKDAKVHGDLTIRGVTKPVELDVEFGGEVVDPWGQHKAGFTITGKLSRKEFGLTWNAVTEAGSVVVSDDVRLIGDIQVIRQA